MCKRQTMACRTSAPHEVEQSTTTTTRVKLKFNKQLPLSQAMVLRRCKTIVKVSSSRSQPGRIVQSTWRVDRSATLNELNLNIYKPSIKAITLNAGHCNWSEKCNTREPTASVLLLGAQRPDDYCKGNTRCSGMRCTIPRGAACR